MSRMIHLLLMLSKVVIFCFANITLIVLSENATEEKLKFIEDNQKLFSHLFTGYKADIPPVYTKQKENVTDAPPPDLLGVALLYVKVAEVNPMKQLMTVIFHYTTIWKDARLIWNPEQFGNITYIYVQRKRVFVPELTPFDSTVVTDTRSKRNQYVKVIFSGWCLYPESTVTSVYCAMNVDNFPFDVHSCSIRMLSNTFKTDEISLENDISPVVSAEDAGNEEWAVLNISSEQGMIFTSTLQTPVNQFNFVVRRYSTYYVSLIIVPSFLLTFLSIAGFFTSNLIVDDKEKYELGLTTIMSASVMISIVSENIPRTKKTPRLTTYVVFNLVIVLAATSLIILIPKCWQFIGLTFTSCKRQQRGWFRRNFWLVRGILTAICFFGFEFWTIKNLFDFLGSDSKDTYKIL